MLGLTELKPEIIITDTTVNCPVLNCNIIVERQRKRFSRDIKFNCPSHKIYISPSTFEYELEEDNLLWRTNDDVQLLNNIKSVKRESRMIRDNSEDAVSWNVFRFLAKNILLDEYLSSFSSQKVSNSNIIYWSYNQQEKNNWGELNNARIDFGETVSRGSEPDMIVVTDKALFFIEAKITAANKTIGKLNSKKYTSGGNNWFSKVFQSNYNTIAIEEKKYELLRFWLLGTWIANNLGLDFFLLNLVLGEREKEIEKVFKKHIIQNNRNKFFRTTWENIYSFIANTKDNTTDKKVVLNYFKNKTIGYDSNRKLQRAFKI